MIIELPLREKFGTVVDSARIIGFQQKIQSKFNGSSGYRSIENDIWVTNIHLDDGVTVSTFDTVKEILSKCARTAFNDNRQAFLPDQNNIPITLVDNLASNSENIVITTLKEFKFSEFQQAEARIRSETYDFNIGD